MDWSKFWEWLKDPLPGMKTYIAAMGLVLHGLWLLTQGEYLGWTELMAGLAALGLRKAIDRPIDDEPPPPHRIGF